MNKILDMKLFNDFQAMTGASRRECIQALYKTGWEDLGLALEYWTYKSIGGKRAERRYKDGI